MKQITKYKNIIVKITLIMTALTFVACSGSDQGQSRTSAGDMNSFYNPNINGGSGCRNCNSASAMGNVLGVTNINDFKMKMDLTLYGTSQYGSSHYSNASHSSFKSGSVAAQGYMEVFRHNSYGCQIPSGSYRIHTKNPGTSLVSSMIDGLDLVAQNLQTGLNVNIKLHQLNLLQSNSIIGESRYRTGFWSKQADFLINDPRYGSCYAGQYAIYTPDVANLF